MIIIFKISALIAIKTNNNEIVDSNIKLFLKI